MTKAEEKTKELKDKSIEATDIGTLTNARDIQALEYMQIMQFQYMKE